MLTVISDKIKIIIEMVYMEYLEQRQEVADFMQRLYTRGLTTCSGGNVSVRADDYMLITPSGKDKANLAAEDIIIYSLKEDTNLTPHLVPSMETDMHKAVYDARNDISAVMHAHPIYASCFTATEEKINFRLIGEAVLVLRNVEQVPYSLMGTEELAVGVKEKAALSEVLLLENHGVLTFGKSLFNAFDKTEVLENAAKMTLVSKLIGRQKELSENKIDEILKIFI